MDARADKISLGAFGDHSLRPEIKPQFDTNCRDSGHNPRAVQAASQNSLVRFGLNGQSNVSFKLGSTACCLLTILAI